MLSLNTTLRTAQTLLGSLILGINAYVTRWYIEHTTIARAPRATILPVFVGACTLLLLPYLFLCAPLQITSGKRKSNPRFFNKWVVLLFDSVLCVFWFVTWTQEAAFRAGLSLCFENICELMTCAAALGALTSCLFAVTTFLASLHVLRTRGQVEVGLPTHKAWVGMDEKAES